MKLRSVFCGLALAACLAAAPAGAEIADSVNVKTTEFDLPNGLHVILSEDHTLPRVAVNVLYKVGSGDESKGRTGFAHLFEHLMFCGSAHVGKGEFDSSLEKVGGSSNAFTMEDYTDYYITVPHEALPLALFLESDRMGFFLDNLRPGMVDEQRDVVKNEVRQRVVNEPYGEKEFALPRLLYPEGHPYSWPVCGSMEDLSAAEYADVVSFFQQHYTPGSASLAIVGDFDTAEARKLVEHWFSDVPKGQVSPRAGQIAVSAQLDGVVRKTLTDKRIDHPYREIVWHSPAQYREGDAACEVLAGILAKNGSIYSRLGKRLCYDRKIADSVWALQESRRLSSLFTVGFTALPGHPDSDLDKIQTIVDGEIARISREPPQQREIDMVVNGLEREYYERLRRINNVAAQLNFYYCGVGEADYFNRVLERYRRVTPQEISECAKSWLRPDRRVELTILPDPEAAKQTGSAGSGGKEAKP